MTVLKGQLRRQGFLSAWLPILWQVSPGLSISWQEASKSSRRVSPNASTFRSLLLAFAPVFHWLKQATGAGRIQEVKTDASSWWEGLQGHDTGHKHIGRGRTYGHLCKHAHTFTSIRTYCFSSHVPLERTCNMPGKGAAKCSPYLLSHFPAASVLLQKGKMNLGEHVAISVPGILSWLPRRVCRGLYPLVLPPVKPERASASPTERVTKFIDFH